MEDNKYSNAYISKMLKQVAAAYEVTGEDKFRIRAYQNAAASVEHATSEAKDLWEEGKLTEIPGVGASIAGHLDEYFKTGKVRHFEQVLRQMPKGMFSLFGLHGIGAKTAYKLASELKIAEPGNALEIVKKAALEGKIKEIEGFGEQSEKELLDVIAKQKPGKQAKKRLLLPDATEVAERYLQYLKGLGDGLSIEPLGSLRRRVATIGDIDFAIATKQPQEALKYFVKFPEVSEILNEGDVKASVLLKNGLRVDLMTEKQEAFGSLLQHFTGSKAHNIALRELALKKGLSLSEHGIKKNEKLKEFSSEEAFYSYLGLEYIPPEIREDTGEIQASQAGKLPNLIELNDIKGDLHTHTDFSDGSNTLEEMVGTARKMGYEYVGISDHAPSVRTRGEAQVLSIIKSTKEKIEHINSSQDDLRVLYGYEVNILTDASLALPDEYLKLLDYSVASIHTSFNQPKDQITKRLVVAIRNPYVTFIGHPSGRLINKRDAYDVDWEIVFKEALEHNKILEINAHPERLDLPDLLVREVVKKGIKLIINTDSHHIDHFKLMRYGIDVARRGWVEKSDVINTLPKEEFLKLFLRV